LRERARARIVPALFVNCAAAAAKAATLPRAN
jgi:hypothetical protein